MSGSSRLSLPSLCLFVLALVASGCKPQSTQKLPSSVELVDETTIGSSDVIEVRVYGEDQLTAKYQVGSDGVISFPFLGPVRVQGKETHVVAQEMATALREKGYMLNPQISIFIVESN